MLMKTKELLERWASSIELFVDECLFAKSDKSPSHQQRAVLQDIDAGYKDISISSGHGTGKSTLLSWVILWVGLFKYDAKIPATAPTAPQLVRLLLPEVRKWREKLPRELKECVVVKNDSVAFCNNNQCVARTARKEAPEGLQGFHATYLCWIIDEASGVPNTIFEVIEGSLTGEEHLRLLTANPTRTDGYFYDSHHKNRELWKIHVFNAEESENVTKESIERKKKEYGVDSDAYRVRVQGRFPRTSSDAVIPMYIIEDALNIGDDYNDYGAEVWGLDYADSGDDRTILVKRVGHYFYEKKECPITGKHRQVNTARWLAEEYLSAKAKGKDPKAIFIDSIGEGSGLMSVLNEPQYANIPAIGCKVSEKPSRPDIYLNLRAELYYKLKKILEEEGKMFDDDSAIGELSAQRFKITEKGVIQIISKKEIKEALGRSPDISDAMALASNTVIATAEEVEEYHERDIYADEIDEEFASW